MHRHPIYRSIIDAGRTTDALRAAHVSGPAKDQGMSVPGARDKLLRHAGLSPRRTAE